jgi:hypothetical protein
LFESAAAPSAKEPGKGYSKPEPSTGIKPVEEAANKKEVVFSGALRSKSTALCPISHNKSCRGICSPWWSLGSGRGILHRFFTATRRLLGQGWHSNVTAPNAAVRHFFRSSIPTSTCLGQRPTLAALSFGQARQNPIVADF